MNENGIKDHSINAIVLYDSVFGNTRQIALAIGKAIKARTLHIKDVKPEDLTGLDLLIAGSPTRGFSATPAMRDFLKSIPGKKLQNVRVAAFDTRMTGAEIDASVFFLKHLVRVFGYAAAPVLSGLKKKGGSPVADPEGFYVQGTEGPLVGGETGRAAQWAMQCQENLQIWAC